MQQSRTITHESLKNPRADHHAEVIETRLSRNISIDKDKPWKQGSSLTKPHIPPQSVHNHNYIASFILQNSLNLVRRNPYTLLNEDYK